MVAAVEEDEEVPGKRTYTPPRKTKVCFIHVLYNDHLITSQPVKSHCNWTCI